MYDIRKQEYEEPTSLRFDDDVEDGGNATVLQKLDNEGQPFLALTDNNGSYLTIESVEAAEGLIKSLQWAITHGWWGDE